MLYEFSNINQEQNFRYSANDTFDRKKSYIYFRSYMSDVIDLNKIKLDRLLKHKQILDQAVDYVLYQLRKGNKVSTKTLPFDTLNKKYRYNVIQYANYLYKLETHSKPEGRENCTQPYWVYNKCLIEYGFRKDKTLKSKFQGFVSFESAYNRDKEPICLNLRLSKKAYKKKDTIFLGGFDIVFNKDNTIQIRHVSEKVVEKKEDNNIERHLVIDSFANIHDVLIDKNFIESDEKHPYRIDVQNKIICGSYQQHKGSDIVQKCIDKFHKFKEPKLFKERLNNVYQNIKNRTLNIIGSDNETKICLLKPTNTTSQIYNSFIKMFTNVVSDICKQQGIKLIIHELPCETIIKQVQDYKKSANNYQGKKKYGYKFKDVNKVKASDIINCSILCEYPEYYIILRKNGKFTCSLAESTSKNDYSVSDKIRIMRQRIKSYELVYPTWEEFEEDFRYSRESKENIRSAWLYTIKSIASEAYERCQYTEAEYNHKLQIEREAELKRKEEERIKDLMTLQYPDKIVMPIRSVMNRYYMLCDIIEPTEQEKIDVHRMAISYIKDSAKEYKKKFIDMNKDRFEYMNIDYNEKYHINSYQSYSYDYCDYDDDEPDFV